MSSDVSNDDVVEPINRTTFIPGTNPTTTPSRWVWAVIRTAAWSNMQRATSSPVATCIRSKLPDLLNVRAIEAKCHDALLAKGLVRIPPTKELFALGTKLTYEQAVEIVEGVINEALTIASMLLQRNPNVQQTLRQKQEAERTAAAQAEVERIAREKRAAWEAEQEQLLQQREQAAESKQRARRSRLRPRQRRPRRRERPISSWQLSSVAWCCF